MKFVVVIHATGIGVHLIGTLLVKLFQPGSANMTSQRQNKKVLVYTLENFSNCCFCIGSVLILKFIWIKNRKGRKGCPKEASFVSAQC